MKKKELFAGIIIGSLLTATGVFAVQYVATDNPFPVQFNGQSVNIQGYNIEGSTYFKLRDIADVVGGFTVGFENGTITIDNGAENELISNLKRGLSAYVKLFQDYCSDTAKMSAASYDEYIGYSKSFKESLLNVISKETDEKNLQIFNAAVPVANTLTPLLEAMKNDAEIVNNKNNPNYIDDIYASGEKVFLLYKDFLTEYVKFSDIAYE